MRIGAINSSVATELWEKVEPQVKHSASVEAAAQILARTLFEEFQESVVLARVFCTVPFDGLPPQDRFFVRESATSAGLESGLRMVTPVLSLLGTYGVEPEWCSRGSSTQHMGIPLISAAFVNSIPMISGLLKELGVPLEWADSYDSTVIEKTIGRTAGLFYVEDAAQATDYQGRKIIASQDFVSRYKVRTTFGVGAGYPGGQIVVLVVFCRDVCPRPLAQHFMAITAFFKQKTTPILGTGRVFEKTAVRSSLVRD